MKSRVLLGLGAALAVGGAACGSDAELLAEVKALGEGCFIDSDCEEDLVCVFQRCHVECETTKDCEAQGAESRCVLGDKPKNVCQLEDEIDCAGTEAVPRLNGAARK